MSFSVFLDVGFFFPSFPARHIFSHELVNIFIGATGIWNFTTIITILVNDTVYHGLFLMPNSLEE